MRLLRYGNPNLLAIQSAEPTIMTVLIQTILYLNRLQVILAAVENHTESPPVLIAACNAITVLWYVTTETGFNLVGDLQDVLAVLLRTLEVRSSDPAVRL